MKEPTGQMYHHHGPASTKSRAPDPAHSAWSSGRLQFPTADVATGEPSPMNLVGFMVIFLVIFCHRRNFCFEPACMIQTRRYSIFFIFIIFWLPTCPLLSFLLYFQEAKIYRRRRKRILGLLHKTLSQSLRPLAAPLLRCRCALRDVR